MFCRVHYFSLKMSDCFISELTQMTFCYLLDLCDDFIMSLKYVAVSLSYFFIKFTLKLRTFRKVDESFISINEYQVCYIADSLQTSPNHEKAFT